MKGKEQEETNRRTCDHRPRVACGRKKDRSLSPRTAGRPNSCVTIHYGFVVSRYNGIRNFRRLVRLLCPRFYVLRSSTCVGGTLCQRPVDTLRRPNDVCGHDDSRLSAKHRQCSSHRATSPSVVGAEKVRKGQEECDLPAQLSDPGKISFFQTVVVGTFIEGPLTTYEVSVLIVFNIGSSLSIDASPAL